jgi:WD40 repeat protein
VPLPACVSRSPNAGEGETQSGAIIAASISFCNLLEFVRQATIIGAMQTFLYVSAVVVLLGRTAALAQAPTDLKSHTGWVGAVAFAPDGKRLASGGADRIGRLWDVGTRRVVSTFKGHENAIAAVAFSAKGDLLATGSFDHTIKVWQPAGGSAVQTLRGHDGPVMTVAFTADGRLLSGSIDGTVRLWDPRSGKALGMVTKHRSWVNAIALAPDGTLATASSDNTVRIFAPRKEWTRRASREVSAGEVRALAFAPDGKHLAVGIRYGGLEVWDVTREPKTVAELKGHIADVWGVAFSPNGKYLASGDGDWDRPGDVFLWDTSTWKKTAALRHSNEVLGLSFSPDSGRLAAGAWDGNIQLWSVPK